MHTLNISTSLPPSRRTQLLHIVTGLSAHQPLPILELVLIARPPLASLSRRATADTQIVGAQQGVGFKKARNTEKSVDGRFVRIVGSVHVDDDDDDEDDQEELENDLNLTSKDRESDTNEDGSRRDTDGDTDMHSESDPGSKSSDDTSRITWTARTSDLPLPNISTHTSRPSMLEDALGTTSSLSSGHDIIAKYLQSKGLVPVAAYAIVGVRWTYARHVDVRLTRIVVSTKLAPRSSDGTRDENEIARGAMHQLSALATGLFSSSMNNIDTALNPTLDQNLTLLDKSGTYVLSADVAVDEPQNSSQQAKQQSSRAEEETNSDAIARNEEARNVLLGLKTRLRGVVDLRPVERLALDSRVKG